MLEKIKELFGKFDENFFSIFITIVTIGLIYLGTLTGDPNVQELSNRGVKVSAFLATSLGLVKYFKTKTFDVWEEIIERKNLSFSIIIAALILGIAACIII